MEMKCTYFEKWTDFSPMIFCCPQPLLTIGLDAAGSLLSMESKSVRPQLQFGFQSSI